MELRSETKKPTIILDRGQATALELKLNVSSKSKLWSHIGDILFDFGTGKEVTSILLTDEQYSFIGVLQRRTSWESCRDL